ncbi:conserved exported hypothetical protein [Verrucomicrobia bacterium]|nr:conserved exported hypothetical protein [Verrucomicrobiota bacterium]
MAQRKMGLGDVNTAGIMLLRHPLVSMFKNLCFGLLSVLTVVALPTRARAQTTPPGYFQTTFQSESQFIVEAVVSDLAEQVYFAAKGRLPESKDFSVAATERSGSPVDAPIYDLQINLDREHRLKLEVPGNSPIWSPGVYHDVAAALAKTMGLRAATAAGEGDTTLLPKLLDGKAETIERENLTLSGALEKGFTNPQLHERAALLLGAFLLREHSGLFFEIRSPLSRMTAHLAIARCLSGTNSFGIHGRLAEAILLTLVNDQALALERLKSFDTKDSAVGGFVRALQARNTGDFRPLTAVAGRSQVESVAWFAAMADYVSAPMAWQKLNGYQRRAIDFIRVANDQNYSVEMGHELLQASIPLEMQEIQSVYELSHHKELSHNGLAQALNELPEGCFTRAPGQPTHVHIIDWGQWAAFLQRHLCHAVQQNFYFMNRKWGVPDEAKQFAAQCEQEFGALRLYPFVRRFNCTDVAAYHKSVDDAFKVTVATPHLVPAQCWNYLCYSVPFAPLYTPNPNPHINEWHNHNPPPGTVYDLQPRLNHPSLTHRPDALGRFVQLHDLAPYDVRIVRVIIERRYGPRASYDQVSGLYNAMMPWSVSALRAVAATVTNKPEQYEQLMLQAAQLNPACYYELGDYAILHKQEDKAAQYIDKACESDPDSIGVASRAEWRISYCLKKGQTAKAREIADFAGDVYSSKGLAAKAAFLEATTNYDGAFEWFAKIEERYGNSVPLLSFCQRYRALTGDTRFEAELKKREKTVFAKGMEKVSLADFHVAPTDGVLLKGQSDLLASAHMRQGQVIVAINGIRVHTLAQYSYLRDLPGVAELDLIVWQGDAFREIRSSPPNRRFGVAIGDYKPSRAAL